MPDPDRLPFEVWTNIARLYQGQHLLIPWLSVDPYGAAMTMHAVAYEELFSTLMIRADGTLGSARNVLVRAERIAVQPARLASVRNLNVLFNPSEEAMRVGAPLINILYETEKSFNQAVIMLVPKIKGLRIFTWSSTVERRLALRSEAFHALAAQKESLMDICIRGMVSFEPQHEELIDFRLFPCLDELELVDRPSRRERAITPIVLPSSLSKLTLCADIWADPEDDVDALYDEGPEVGYPHDSFLSVGEGSDVPRKLWLRLVEEDSLLSRLKYIYIEGPAVCNLVRLLSSDMPYTRALRSLTLTDQDNVSFCLDFRCFEQLEYLDVAFVFEVPDIPESNCALQVAPGLRTLRLSSIAGSKSELPSFLIDSDFSTLGELILDLYISENDLQALFSASSPNFAGLVTLVLRHEGEATYTALSSSRHFPTLRSVTGRWHESLTSGRRIAQLCTGAWASFISKHAESLTTIRIEMEWDTLYHMNSDVATYSSADFERMLTDADFLEALKAVKKLETVYLPAPDFSPNATVFTKMGRALAQVARLVLFVRFLPVQVPWQTATPEGDTLNGDTDVSTEFQCLRRLEVIKGSPSANDLETFRVDSEQVDYLLQVAICMPHTLECLVCDHRVYELERDQETGEVEGLLYCGECDREPF